MLSSISPLGERARGSRWWLTTTAYVVGSLLGGLALGLLAALAFAAPARSAEVVVAQAAGTTTTTTTTSSTTAAPPATGTTVIKRTETTTVPSADAAAASVNNAARKTSAAVSRTARKAQARLNEATHPRTRVERSTTTVDSGAGQPVTVTRERRTTP